MNALGKWSESILIRLRESSVRQTMGTVILVTFRRMANVLVGFLLAGILGASAYGSYSFAISSLNILQTVCFLGLDVLLVREIARYNSTQDYESVSGLIRFSFLGMVGATVLVVLGLLAADIFIDAESLPQLRVLTRTAPVILPLIVAMRFSQAILRGLQEPTIGLLPEFMIRPLLIIVLVLVFNSVFEDITAPQALWMFAASTAAAMVAAFVFLRYKFPANAARARPCIQAVPWMRAATSLLYVFFLQALYADASVVFLGLLSTAEETARFRLAFMLASLIPFLMTAISTSLGPIVSGHLAEGRKKELQDLLSIFARVSFIFGIPLAIIGIAFGERVLSYFGDEYRDGYVILVILSVFQFINVGVGSAMTVLTMSGKEGRVIKGITLVAALSLILNPVFIPLFGGVGAAWATGISMSIWNLYLLRAVKVHVGINTSVLGRMFSGEISPKDRPADDK